MLQWERSWLEAQLSGNFSKPQQRELFQQWGIVPGSLRRKRQLINRLWSPDTLKCARTWSPTEGCPRGSIKINLHVLPLGAAVLLAVPVSATLSILPEKSLMASLCAWNQDS